MDDLSNLGALQLQCLIFEVLNLNFRLRRLRGYVFNQISDKVCFCAFSLRFYFEIKVNRRKLKTQCMLIKYRFLIVLYLHFSTF